MSAAIGPGAVLQGTYEIVRLIGAGGMGEVYEARHRRLSGRYAVKMLLEARSADPESLARFHREAAITSGLRHPNIVQVIDFNQTPDGTPYLVMEYLEGSPLDVRVPRGARLPINQAVWVVNQLASALAAAHSHGIVHRDLKPQNTFLVKMPGQRQELVKVLDFGISKVRSAATALTRSVSVLGTPQYIAPEQTERADAVDARADQFALAAITYELLTGVVAFTGETIPEVLHQVLYGEPRPLADFALELRPEVEEVIRIGLSKQPDARFPDILAYSHALERAAQIDERDEFARSEQSSIGRGPPRWSPQRPKATETLFYAADQVRPRAPEKRPRDRTPPPTLPPTPNLALTIDALDDLRALTPPRRKAPIIAAAVIALGLGAVLLPRLRAPQPAPRVEAVPATVPAATPAPARAAVEQVQIDVVSATAGVQVTVDGVVGDLPIRLERGAAVHVLRFEAPGHEPREFKVNGLKNRTLTVHLHRHRGAAASPDAPPGAAPGWKDPFTEGNYANEHKARPGGRRGSGNPF